MNFIIASDGTAFRVDADVAETFGDLTWTHSQGYAKRNDRGKTVYLHRLILGAGDGTTVDHVDGDLPLLGDLLRAFRVEGR